MHISKSATARYPSDHSLNLVCIRWCRSTELQIFPVFEQSMVPSRASSACVRHGLNIQTGGFCSLCSTNTVDINNCDKRIECHNSNVTGLVTCRTCHRTFCQTCRSKVDNLLLQWERCLPKKKQSVACPECRYRSTFESGERRGRLRAGRKRKGCTYAQVHKDQKRQDQKRQDQERQDRKRQDQKRQDQKRQDQKRQHQTPQDQTPQDQTPQDQAPQDQTPQDQTPQDQAPQDHTQHVGKKRRRKPKPKQDISANRRVSTLDGALVFPEYNVALTTNCNNYYVHALSDAHHSALHGVVTYDVACRATGIRPSPSPYTEKTIDGLRVGIYMYSFIATQSHRKGQSPTVDDVEKCDLLDVGEYDVIVVAGWHDGPEMLLLGCVMKDQNPLRSYGGTLFKEVVSSLPRDGMEVRRTGGSSGCCRYDKEFTLFLHTHGCFPRVCRGVVIVPYKPKDRDRPTMWKCLYFSPYKKYHSALVSASYTPPVLGGKLRLRDHDGLMRQFPKFEHFYRQKCELMMVIEKINIARRRVPEWKPLVQTKIDLLKKTMAARSYLQATVDCTHTMVTHRVGYHYDVFHTNSCGIENKVLVPAEGKGGKKDGSCPSLGRGGGGAGVFTYAILDW